MAIRPGIVLPGIVAELPRLRNGVEDPQSLAGPYVEAPHVTFLVVSAFRIGPGVFFVQTHPWIKIEIAQERATDKAVARPVN